MNQSQKKRPLRSGYTTGACAAATAKGAALFFLTGEVPPSVDIPFPDGTRHHFAFTYSAIDKDGATTMGLKKDAGDDPDVTNKALIMATVQPAKKSGDTKAIDLGGILLVAGKGVGMVTKPGLAIAPGEPAINPVPRMMIAEAVAEVTKRFPSISTQKLQVTIAVPEGEFLSTKTLNHRLGIVGGLSILGTTGIVRPVSASAWKDTVSASMSVARKTGLDDIVLSTGRTSEKGVQEVLYFPVEAYAMMGDFLHFSLTEAARYNFKRIHYAGMWAKVMKAALCIPHTHVRNGALEVKQAADLLIDLGATGDLQEKIIGSNTAREMLYHLIAAQRDDLIMAVCKKAKIYAENVSGKIVHIYLINDKAEVIHYE